jgi:hypothetical protein
MSHRKITIQIGCLLLGWVLAACVTPGQVGVKTPQGKLPDYPLVIERTAARELAIDAAWRALLAEQQLPETTRYESEPALLTPRGLPAELAGRIQITASKGTLSDLEWKEALRRFIEKNALWLGVNAGDTAIGQPDLSLVTLSNEGNLVRAVYAQRSYLHPIAEGFGELRFMLSRTGNLMQLSSTILPLLTLPARPAIEASELPERFVNREFTYSNIAGQPMRYKIQQVDEVFVKELVVYPRVVGERMTVHLAYPIFVGKGTTWTVYVDAMTGEELGVKANFVS